MEGRKRLQHIAELLSGNLAASLIGFAATAMTARAVGPRDFGVLALTFSYVQAVERLVSFQSWQPLIRYGADLMGEHDKSDLKKLLKFGMVLDITGGAAAWAVAIVGAFAGAILFNWSQDTTQLVMLYSTVLLFNLNNMATAVLRLSGRFRMMAYGQVAGALLRLVLVAAAWRMNLGILGYAAVWMASQLFSSLAVIVSAARTLRLLNITGLLATPLSGMRLRFPGIWGFSLSTNVSLTVRASAQQLDTLLVGALADPVSAGLYHLAKRISKFAQQVATQVQAVIYPEVARFIAREEFDQALKAVRHVELILLVFGIGTCVGALFLADPFLRIVAGPQFVAAAPLLIVQLVAVTLTISGVATRSALLARGWERRVLEVVVATTACFFAVAVVMIPLVGAMGATIAHVISGLVWIIGLTSALRKALPRQGLPRAAHIDEPAGSA